MSGRVETPTGRDWSAFMLGGCAGGSLVAALWVVEKGYGGGDALVGVALAFAAVCSMWRRP